MRNIPLYTKTKLELPKQTIADNADVHLIVKAVRPLSTVTDPNFIQYTSVDTSTVGSYTDCSIAVEHSENSAPDRSIWLASIHNGYLQVHRSLNGTVFVDVGVEEEATSCSICFDAIIRENVENIDEFVTDEVPYIFWVTPEGQLKASKYGANEDITLADSNVTNVSAVRGSYSPSDKFNLGLIVFFTVESGALFYRQHISGHWYDAEQVTFGPAGVQYTDIAAFRTWDYRVGIQCMTSNGTIYELFTQFEGIGTRNQEHITIFNAGASGHLTAISYHDGYTKEHIELANATAACTLLWGVSPIPANAYNVEFEGDYGILIYVVMDHELASAENVQNYFVLTDSNGVQYGCSDVTLLSDNLTLRLTMANFNLAYTAENVTIAYTAPETGGMMSPVVKVNSFSKTFVPTGLVRPVGTPPRVVRVENI